MLRGKKLQCQMHWNATIVVYIIIALLYVTLSRKAMKQGCQQIRFVNDDTQNCQT